MQTPKRKAGQYAHLKPDPHITEEKYNELKARLEKLKNISRPREAAEVKRLAEMGDFSENAAYQIAKGRLRGINQRILEIKDHLERAIIIKPDKSRGRVQIGNRVTVKTNGRRQEFLILGSAETNPGKGIISHRSPIGAGLLGLKEGDKTKIKLADKVVEYEIIKIE